MSRLMTPFHVARCAEFPLAMGCFPSVQSELEPCAVHSLHVSKPLAAALPDNFWLTDAV